MPLNKASYYFLVVTICILLIVLPQVNSAGYAQSTLVSKFIVFAYGCSVIIGSFLLMFVFSKQKTVQIPKLDIVLLLLFAYIIVNRYFIQTNYGLSLRFLELIGLGALYIVLRNLPVKAYTWLLLAIIVSGSIQAIYGNLQLLGYCPSNHAGFKLTGSFFNPGPYAGFLVVVWPMALSMYLFKEKLIALVYVQISSNSSLVNTIVDYVFKYIPLLGVISIILVIPATHSRAAWLAVLLSSTVLLELRYHFIKQALKKLTQIKKIALVALVLSIFFTGLFGIYYFKKESADGRLFIWKVTSEIIKDHPITGVGFDRFKAHYMNYQADYFSEYEETKEALVADNTYYAFNECLQFFAEQGLIGLLLLLLVVYAFLNIKIATKQAVFKYLALGVFVAVGTFASFSYPMQILPFKLVVLVLLSMLALLDTHKYTINMKHRQTVYMFSKSIISFMIILFLVKEAPFSKKVPMAYKDWETALNVYQYGDYESAISYYKEAYPILKKEGDFLMNYGKALVMCKKNEDAINVLEQAKQHLNTTIIETALGDAYKEMKKYDKAERAYQNAANMIPVRFYPLYLLAKMYEESGQHQKAIAMAKQVLEKEVKVPSTAIEEIKAEMKQILEKAPGQKTKIASIFNLKNIKP
ncbi:MAG: O-antigen ligase family protein [Bacteroidales bacterium]